MTNDCFVVRAGFAMGPGKGHRMRTQRHAYLSLNCVANVSVIGLHSLEPLVSNARDYVCGVDFDYM